MSRKVVYSLILTSTKQTFNLFYFRLKDFSVELRHHHEEPQKRFLEQKKPKRTHDVGARNKFYEVDAHGDDYVDFGALTGQNGAFSWHANFPLE